MKFLKHALYLHFYTHTTYYYSTYETEEDAKISKKETPTVQEVVKPAAFVALLVGVIVYLITMEGGTTLTPAETMVGGAVITGGDFLTNEPFD